MVAVMLIWLFEDRFYTEDEVQAQASNNSALNLLLNEWSWTS